MRGALATLVVLATAACYATDRVEDPSVGDAFPVAHDPMAMPPQGLAFVTDDGSDQISVLDLAQTKVVAQPVVAVDPVAINGPHELAIDMKGGYVYTLLTFPPPAIAPGPHGSHGLSAVPGVLLKLSLSDLSRVSALTVDVNPGDVQTTPDGSKVLVSHFDLTRAIQAEVRGLPVDQMRATLMVIDAASMQPIVDVPVCVAPHEIDVSEDGKTVYLACYGEDAIGIVHLDDPELVTNPTHAVERFPVGGAAGPPANPAYGPYSISVANGQAFVANSVSKTFEVIDLASRTPLRSIPFVGTVFVPGEGVAPNQWLVPTQAPDALALVDVATGVTIASRPTADCVKPHQIAGLGKRYFLTCEGDHTTPSVVLEIDPATLSTIRTVAVGVYPDVIAFAGGP